MTLKRWFITTGTVSLKTLRALWKELSVVGMGLAGIFAQGMKHASAANDDSDEDKPYGHESAEHYSRAAAKHYEDWYH
jgi:hypothetical protein